MLGVPTIADRVAQTVVAMHLGERAEPRFHRDSYGYRPSRSAHDALAECRARCWKYDWIIDLDVQKFFDTVPWDLVVRAVETVTDARWVLLYVKRWLAAPLQRPDGALVSARKGTPQGSAVSPILANLFMHFAFDQWMARNFPGCPFERYADDAVVHCASRRQAEAVLAGIAARMQEVGLRLHPDKTRIVYCKDSNRRGSTSTPALPSSGSAFGHGRPAQGRRVVYVVLARDQPRRAQGQRRRAPRDADPPAPDLSLDDLARWLNPIVAGWMRYYGRFNRRVMHPLLRRVSTYLRRWAGKKYRGCGATSDSSGGGPDCSTERPACSPTGSGSVRTDRRMRRAR